MVGGTTPVPLPNPTKAGRAMPTTSNRTTSNRTTATKATSKATSPKASKSAPKAAPVEQATPAGPYVPNTWHPTGGRGKGFVHYQRTPANGHAVSGYNVAEASSPAQRALVADIAKATGIAADALGAHVVVDWSTGNIATGLATWGDALAIVRHFGGQADSLAGSVYGGATKALRGAIDANGVVPRPVRERQVPNDEQADEPQPTTEQATEGAMAGA